MYKASAQMKIMNCVNRTLNLTSITKNLSKENKKKEK